VNIEGPPGALALLAALLAALLSACAETPRGPSGPAAPPAAPVGSAVTPAPFIGPTWWLVAHRSMDDAIGTRHPAAPYSLRFEPDGTLLLRAHCNRGRGRWLYDEPSGLRLGPLALTRAACAPTGLYDRVVTDLDYVRSFVMKDGGLFLATLADGAILEFRPRTQPSFDCEEADNPVAVRICADPELAARDRELEVLFQQAMEQTDAAGREALRGEQRRWLQRRDGCQPSAPLGACVAGAYAQRLRELSARPRPSPLP
jgi:uncharacterized protein YecT (DUF1311 family)